MSLNPPFDPYASPAQRNENDSEEQQWQNDGNSNNLYSDNSGQEINPGQNYQNSENRSDEINNNGDGGGALNEENQPETEGYGFKENQNNDEIGFQNMVPTVHRFFKSFLSH